MGTFNAIINPRQLVFVAAIFILCGKAAGYDPERAKTNLSHELAECGVYYALASEGSRRVGDSRLESVLDEASRRAIELAISFSNAKVTEARLKLAMKAQREKIDNNYSNFSILNLAYGEICKEAVESPDKRLRYWLTRED